MKLAHVSTICLMMLNNNIRSQFNLKRDMVFVLCFWFMQHDSIIKSVMENPFGNVTNQAHCFK